MTITPKKPQEMVTRALLAAKDMTLNDTRSFPFLEFHTARMIERAITGNSDNGKYGNGRIITVGLTAEANERFTVVLTKRESIGASRKQRK